MMRRLLIVCIKAYQLLLSPYNITCCRFQPTCSEYAIEAIRCYGCIRGMRKAVLRLLKCRPLGRFGYDPVE